VLAKVVIHCSNASAFLNGFVDQLADAGSASLCSFA
jgi:hypothetical protein